MGSLFFLEGVAIFCHGVANFRHGVAKNPDALCGGASERFETPKDTHANRRKMAQVPTKMAAGIVWNEKFLNKHPTNRTRKTRRTRWTRKKRRTQTLSEYFLTKASLTNKKDVLLEKRAII